MELYVKIYLRIWPYIVIVTFLQEPIYSNPLKVPVGTHVILQTKSLLASTATYVRSKILVFIINIALSILIWLLRFLGDLHRVTHKIWVTRRLLWKDLCILIYIYIWTKVIWQLGIFLCNYFLIFDCSHLISILGCHQKKSFICHKRSDEKLTSNIAKMLNQDYF